MKRIISNGAAPAGVWSDARLQRHTVLYIVTHSDTQFVSVTHSVKRSVVQHHCVLHCILHYVSHNHVLRYSTYDVAGRLNNEVQICFTIKYIHIGSYCLVFIVLTCDVAGVQAEI